ncbi:hypothetical protein [Cobetia amphilecti]|uniref:Lipoprotein n=1 Tax=Cobetia amphilecti TaxID=1055104 RepID=A0AAP4TW42_9GAMM|nr:hypothetical protein [Cobetia amphilecti]MDO6670829.1 hypothetical protein [Cobetia amphilecti]
MKPTSIMMGGRLAAPLLVSGALMLGGCSALEQGQLGQTASAILGSDQFDAERARALPYATLRFSYDGNTGMVVLASLETATRKDMDATDATYQQEHAGLTPMAALPSSATPVESTARQPSSTTELARFETADHAFVRLENGWLSGTAGFDTDLLDMRRDVSLATLMSALDRGETTPSYVIHSRWQRADGIEGYAQGQASWQCAAPAVQALPLGDQTVAQCEENILWQDGSRSVNRYAVATVNNPPATDANAAPRIWAADVQPWPDSHYWSWEVARGWW